MRPALRCGLGLLAAALALPACSTTTSTVTGLALAAPGEPGRRRVGPSIRVTLDERLRAEVRTTDRVPADAASPALSLSLAFDAKELGYSIHAGQLVLRDGRGGEWRPASASAAWMRYGSCEGGGRASAGDPLVGYVPVARGSCVLVEFDRGVGPGERLELVIAGVAVGQRRLDPVTVSLTRTEQKSRKADPVLVEFLTLPLKILLFPLAMYGGT
jgi:hypothetical protein